MSTSSGSSESDPPPPQVDKEERRGNKYLLSLDIGTSNIRCFMYDQYGKQTGRFMEAMEVEFPEPNAVEINPSKLWEKIEKVITGCILDSGIEACHVTAMGMSVQRGTFMVWDKISGKPIHNFIVWQDTRSEKISESWNTSYWFRTIQKASRCLHFFTKNNKYLAAAVLHFHPQQASMRLVWLLEKYPELKKRARRGEICFGTLDTWVIWKLTGGKTFASEYSNASSTGLYDPFTLNWSGFVCNMLGIPMEIFPEVLDTNGDFGVCEADLFGAEIPIRASAGDQQAAMFGQGCFDVGDLKFTLGTGAFLTLNVGRKAHASVKGFYPVIGWKIGDEVVHLAEGCSNTCGGAIEWIKKLGFIKTCSEIDQTAELTCNSGGLYFVPSFNGLQAPVMDYSACGALIGITLSTQPCQIARAVLESLAFRNYELYQSLQTETNIKVGRIVCDGGVSASNFVVSLSSDMIGQPIERRSEAEMSALGVAFMAGLATGVWDDKTELLKLIKTERTFTSSKENRQKYKPIFHQWHRAVERAMHWYGHGKAVPCSEDIN